MSNVAKQEKKKQSQSSSQQTKPSYCMCTLPLPSVWVISKCPYGKKQNNKEKSKPNEKKAQNKEI